MRFWFGRAVAEDPVYRHQLAGELIARRRLPARVDPHAPGHVVEFVKSGQPLCGVLLRRGSRADRILDVHGKESYVDHAKIVHVSSAFIGLYLSRHEIVRALRASDRERERLKAAIDPYELWEVVQPEGREWEFDELAELYFAGSPGPHGEAALFRALEHGRAFTRRGKTFISLSKEAVAKNKGEDLRALESDAWIREAAAWLRAVADGIEKPAPPNAGRAAEILAAKVLFGSDHPDAKHGSALARLAHFHSPQAIFHALVRVGFWDRDENLHLLRHEIPIAFTAQTLAEAVGLPATGTRCPRY